MNENEPLPPVQIPLRAKYRSASRGRYKSSSNDQGVHHRNKIGYDKHVARYGVPPKRIMVMKPNGATVMVNADELEKKKT